MKNVLLLFILSLLSITAHSQAVSWELSAEPGDQASNPASFQSNNFSNCNLSRGAGVTATTGAGSMNASAWFSGVTPTTLADAISGNDYYEFTCNTINCIFFNPTTIKIVLRSSATGPNTATLRCSSDGFSANIGTVTVTTTSTAFSFSETISPNSQSVTYRLYGYGAAAGGGTPSAGGTMRIGTSVVASDNDLEIFATTTTVQVAQVANITVIDGDPVPATVLTANVPGATINWSRTLPNFGLSPTSGTGNVPAFTAFSGGGTITGTFTVNATVGNCQGPDMTFTITVTPAPCSITVDFFGSPSGCNDNGTPNDPSDDFFTQNIHANLFNRPTTGDLQIVPGGDQIGIYSIPVGQINGNSHTFAAVKLKADGTPSNVQMNFTANPGCIDADTGPTVQPCSSGGPPCEIIGFTFANIGSCNDNGTPGNSADDFFLVDVDVLFSNSLGGATQLRLNGADVIVQMSVQAPVGTNLTHKFVGAKLRADGQITDINADIFNAAPICSGPGTGPAVNSCSSGGGACDITSVTLTNVGSCNDNGTNDPTDDFFPADVVINFVNRPSTGLLQIEPGGDAITIHNVAVASLPMSGSHTFTNVHFKADGTVTVVEVEFTVPANQCVRTIQGPTVQPCSPVCDITSVSLLNVGPCNDNGTNNNPNDDFFPADVVINFVNRPSTGLLQIEPGGDAITVHNVAVAGLPVSGSHTFTNVHFKADGTVTVVEVEFTVPANQCVRTFQGPTVQPCSFPPPVLICPAAAAVSCANEVPAVNPASVSETHSCPGTVTITHLSDVNSNVTCINKLTITRTYKATDQCGNSATCSQTITINDQTPPTVTCPGPLSLTCASQVPAVDVSLLGVTDNCAGTLGISRSFVGEVTSNSSCANRFTLTRTYKGGDACGNTATCTQVITVNDQTPPSLTCPAAQTVSCASQVPAQNIALVTGLSDNCGGAAPTASFVGDVTSNQSCTNRFTLTRTYRATDACGNSATCSQVITVNDQTGPVIACPAAQTFSCAEQVPAPNPALVTGSDNCGGAITPSFFSNTISNQTCTNRFTLTRQYRAADACGNTSSCTQVITVNDQTPPVFTFVPANVTVDCYLIPGVGTPTASDNCTSGATVVFLGEVSVPGICPVWKILTRTWRATDVCGNSATASQVVTVTDFNAPQFLVLPKNKIVECGPNNLVEFQAFLDNRGGAVVEDCSQITYSHADSPFQSNYFDCGNTFHKNIRFFFTDECQNVSYRDASFTVVDQTPPVFSTPPQSVDLECDASSDNGELAFYDWLDSNAGLVAEDNCGELELEKIQINEYAGCGNTWRKTYEFRAKDECGNVSKTTATFSVVDHTPPMVDCPANDNVFLPCVEDVPAADPNAISVHDCNGVTTTLTDTWTNGTGCPGWPMTVAYRYTATDGCGNQAICERAFYVEETTTPTLLCPDTIKLICVNDIPGPAQLFGYIKAQLVGNCSGGFSSITILSDSGQPQNGTTHRTYKFKAKNHCGKVSSACSVTFKATGTCNQLCTASQDSWGDPNGTVGGMPTADALQSLLTQHGPVTVGGGNHLVSAADPACVQEMLFGSGGIGFLPTGNYACPLPSSLSNPDGSLNNQLAANAMVLQLNIWYNQAFNNRNFGGQNLHKLPPCLVDFEMLKDMGQNSTVNDLLEMTNQYLQGFVGNHPADFPALLNEALDNLNYFRVDCGLNAPCERPGNGRSASEMVLHDNYKVFPNPTTGKATLEYWAEKEGVGALKISDLRGTRQEQNLEFIKGNNIIEINLTEFPSGIYILTLQGERMFGGYYLVKLDN